MKPWICALILFFVLATDVQAAELPQELMDTLPEAAEDILEMEDISGPESLAEGLERLARRLAGEVQSILRQRLRGAASILLVAVACGAVDGFAQGTGEGKTTAFVPMAGALAVTLLTAGSLEDLIGLGAETIGELNFFSKALLPTLAAATAASGAVTTATFQQVTTVFLADVLMNLIDGLLIPLVYLYIGALAAGACLPENRLGAIAEGLKKIITWMLASSLLLFTVYLSTVRVVAGSADGAAVKVAKAAISGAVPVVGSIIAEAAETVLAGAGMLKNTIGIFGMLAILAACAYPFLQLGIQYLLYKLSAFLAAAAGAPELCKLIDGLGGAFGLVLGMTGSCALLLLVSVLSSVAAVTP